MTGTFVTTIFYDNDLCFFDLKASLLSLSSKRHNSLGPRLSRRYVFEKNEV